LFLFITASTVFRTEFIMREHFHKDRIKKRGPHF
jgi:hypothetical protein